MEKAITKFNYYLSTKLEEYKNIKNQLVNMIDAAYIVVLPETTCIIDGKKFDIKNKKQKMEVINCLENEITFITNIIRILSLEKGNGDLHNDIFVGFKILSSYLLSSSLNSKEQLFIIMNILEKNISAGILTKKPEQSTIIDPTLVNYDFKYLTKDQFIKIACDKRFNMVLNSTNDDKLSEKQKNQKRELKEALESCSIQTNLGKIIENHKKIKEKFLDKTENYTYEDLEKIIEALKELEVDDKLCTKFKWILERKLNKEKEPKYKKVEYIQNKQENKYLTDKEYKSIKKELRNYFDFYHMQKIRSLTEEEILYCTKQLLKIGENKDVIRLFLMIMNRDNEEEKISINPITKYLKNYEKIKYYEDKLNINEEMKTLEYCFKEIFITDGYSDWKKLIEEELNQVLSKIPDNYEYEIYKASICDSAKKMTYKK